MKNLLKNVKGFTLLELLVVVLIIGILAGIALPQYKYVKYKTQFVQLRTVVDALVRAQKMYYITHDKYAERLDDLDIEFPEGGTLSNNGLVVTYKNWNIAQMNEGHYVILARFSGNSPVNYYHYYSGRKECRARNNLGKKVCEKLGAKYKGDATNYTLYIF